MKCFPNPMICIMFSILPLISFCRDQTLYNYKNWKAVLELAREKCNSTCFTLGRYSKDCKDCKRNLQDCDPFVGSGPYLGDVRDVEVTFSGKIATISWSAINLTGVIGAENFTGYYVIWLTSKIIGNVHKNLNFSGTCKEIEKYEACRTTVESTRVWSYPDSILVFVTTAPLPRMSKFPLTTYQAPDKSIEYISGLPTDSPAINRAAWIAGGVSGGAVLAGMFVAFMCYRRKKVNEHQTEEFQHDLFISYSRQDGEFLTQKLIPLLEKHSIKYCVDYKDWIPGKPWHENLVQCIRDSRKILIIASSNSVCSENCKAELEQAQYWAGSNMIILRVDSFSLNLLPNSVARKTFIDYSDTLLERKTWSSRLIKAVKSSGNVNNRVSRQQLCQYTNNNFPNDKTRQTRIE